MSVSFHGNPLRVTCMGCLSSWAAGSENSSHCPRPGAREPGRFGRRGRTACSAPSGMRAGLASHPNRLTSPAVGGARSSSRQAAPRGRCARGGVCAAEPAATGHPRGRPDWVQRRATTLRAVPTSRTLARASRRRRRPRPAPRLNDRRHQRRTRQTGSNNLTAWHDRWLWPCLRRMKSGHYRTTNCRVRHHPEGSTAARTDRGFIPNSR